MSIVVVDGQHLLLPLPLVPSTAPSLTLTVINHCWAPSSSPLTILVDLLLCSTTIMLLVSNYPLGYSSSWPTRLLHQWLWSRFGQMMQRRLLLRWSPTKDVLPTTFSEPEPVWMVMDYQTTLASPDESPPLPTTGIWMFQQNNLYTDRSSHIWSISGWLKPAYAYDKGVSIC